MAITNKEVTNKVDLIAPRHSCSANGCNWIGLNEGGDTNQSVPYDIPHTLGADTKQTATVGTGWVDNTGHSYTATLATSALSALSTATTANVQINFTISGYTAGSLEGYSADGTYTVDVTDDSLDGVGFSGTVLINSVKEITNHDIPYEVDGVEKVTNGTFDTDTTEWTLSGGGALSVDTNRLKMTDYAGTLTYAQQLISESGTFEVTVDYDAGTASGCGIWIDSTTFDTSPDLVNSTLLSGSGTFTTTFTTTGSIYLRLVGYWNDSVANGEVCYFDNVSVKEVTLGSAHLTTLPKTGGSHVTYGNTVDGGSSEELLINGDFTDGLTGWTVSNGTNVANRLYLDGDEAIESIFGKSYMGTVSIGDKFFVSFDYEITVGRFMWGTDFTNTQGARYLSGTGSVGATITITDTRQDYVQISAENDNAPVAGYFDNVSVTKVMPVSTTYDITESHANTFTTDVALTDADRVLLDANPNLVAQLYFGDLTTGLSFSASNVKNLSLGNEGVAGGNNVYDIVNATTVAIANPTANCRAFFVNLNDGVNNLKLIQDSNGEATGYVGDGEMVFANADGRNLPMNLYLNIERYRFTEVVSGVLQNFGADSKQSATSIPAGIVESPTHLYTGTTSTGTISGITTEVSGNIKVNYTVSGLTAGTVEGASVDGNYEVVIAYTDGIDIVGFTGVITINDVKGLTTTSEQKQYRVLEHDAKVEGSDMYTTGTEALTVSDEIATLTPITDGYNLTVSTVGTNNQRPIVSLNTILPNEIGAYYKVSFNAVVPSGTAVVTSYNFGTYTGGLNYTIVDGYNEFIITTSTFLFQATFTLYFDGTQLFNVNITDEKVQKLTEENSLYINGVLDTTTPVLPDPATLITLDDTAVIGYADTVTRRYKAVNLDDATQPNVLSTDIKTAQDALDEYNAWLLLGY